MTECYLAAIVGLIVGYILGHVLGFDDGVESARRRVEEIERQCRG